MRIEAREREQSLKRDPNPGSGHIIALGELNHWGEWCQMLRNYLTNRERTMRVLNLYAGLGGNRKLWEGCEVVAVESHEKIAEVYQRLHPEDDVVVGDAHEYLRQNFRDFDFIWSSPPCPTHSRMAKATRHKNRNYPDMGLYQEILFLQHFYKGDWVVENVKPFYDFLVPPTTTVGRHCFWSNYQFEAEDVKRPENFINLANLAGKKALMDWLDIHYDENIYYKGNHCPAQILRNCVHPKLGLQIFNQRGDA
jgi:DNA (cytosine-5)-methyltransferase 1